MADHITTEQCRVARNLLGWTAEDLAEAARVSLPGIGSFERGLVAPPPERLAAIIGALEAAGVEFTDEAPGVRLSLPDERQGE